METNPMGWVLRLFKAADPNVQRNGKGPEASASVIATVVGDNPIRAPEEDAIGREPAARSFANQVLKLDAREGFVVGVLGPWGSGKTSFMNLARNHLEDSGTAILEFNPWMFSGAEQLVTAFFGELSSQLKLRRDLAGISEGLQEYGDALTGLDWIPGAGTWIKAGGSVMKLASSRIKKRDRGLGGRRKKLEEVLRKLERPIVVVLDDIDRLTTTEIRDIFKLVRLTASFPNIIYLVAFDRLRVESALSEDGFAGRAYLEKILQLGIDLPAVPSGVLQRQILSSIDSALKNIDRTGPFDEELWPDAFVEIVHPLICSMRDVRRYAAAINGTVSDLQGQIALVDVLALEAVRVFLPDVFQRVHAAVSGLTTPAAGYGNDPNYLKQQVDTLINASGDHEKVVDAMVRRLFPSAERHLGGPHYGGDFRGKWLRERRVAHEDVLRLYLERVVGEGLSAFADAERAWNVLSDRASLDAFLRSLDPTRLQDVIASLEAYEEEFTAEHVVPAVVVLLNLLPDIPERQQGMFDLDTRMVVGRVVYRLLRSINNQDQTRDAVAEALNELTTLAAKLELISDVGYREGRGHKLVPEDAARRFESGWRAEVRAASAEVLEKEQELLWIMLLTKREAEDGEPRLEVPEAPAFTLALLRAARSESRSQTAGTRAVRRNPRLAWDALVEIYGNQEALRRCIDDLKLAHLEGGEEILLLADKYLEGWRPGHHNDD